MSLQLADYESRAREAVKRFNAACLGDRLFLWATD